jgi:hypothetical protein
LNNLLSKLKDPEIFVISCSLGNIKFKNTLCDLEANVSLISKLVFERLRIKDLKHTNISLQMVDESVRLSIEILDGIPIQVGKFFIPIDFVVGDMKEDPYIPIILGRPFLIVSAKIVVKCKKKSLNF